MEGITNIEKTKEDVERCMKIVQARIKEEMTPAMLETLTKEIMDTALFIGGDFGDDNIDSLAHQYLSRGGFDRFKRSYKG